VRRENGAMHIRERILREFEELILEARQIISAGGFDGDSGWRKWPRPDEYLRIRTRAQNLIRRACGENSDHYKSLLRFSEQGRDDTQTYRLPDCLGILEAARLDFDRGLLLDLKALVQAEALGDFMEQAESLLSAGYYVPAASLGGAVLEDGMRKLCDARNVKYPAKTKIDALNSELARNNVSR
jgi:hypothetical protein